MIVTCVRIVEQNSSEPWIEFRSQGTRIRFPSISIIMSMLEGNSSIYPTNPAEINDIRVSTTDWSYILRLYVEESIPWDSEVEVYYDFNLDKFINKVN